MLAAIRSTSCSVNGDIASAFANTGRPTVRVRVGPPVDLAYDDVDKDTTRIMVAIVDQLPDEARVHRQPTEEELARTYPHGYLGDPVAEATRRPGIDT